MLRPCGVAMLRLRETFKAKHLTGFDALPARYALGHIYYRIQEAFLIVFHGYSRNRTSMGTCRAASTPVIIHRDHAKLLAREQFGKKAEGKLITVCKELFG